MNKINIYSHDEFLVEINSKNYIIDEINSIEILDIKDSVIAKIYPINQSRLSLPFCVKLYYQDNNLSCDSQFCKIYKLKDRYDIFISPFLISSHICLYTDAHVIKNIKYVVCCFEDRIKISSTKGEYTYEVCAKSFSSTTENNHILILCKDNIKHLVAFNCTDNTFYEIKGDQIQIDGASVKSLLNINDTFNHTVVNLYKIDTTIELLSSDLYTPKNTFSKIKNPELCAYTFFESIKINDLKLAHNCMHKNLRDKISDSALKSFLGSFEYIKLSSTTPLVYTLYSFDTAKDYSITMRDGLIEDIDEF